MNTDVVIYTRPGCPYCYRLRRGLRRRGVPFGEVNIRHDSVATATVRAHADGTETVPTVRIGGRWLVNPTAAAVSAEAGYPARPARTLRMSRGRRTGGAIASVLTGTPSSPRNGKRATLLPALREWITPPPQRLLWPAGIRYALLIQHRLRSRAGNYERREHH